MIALRLLLTVASWSLLTQAGATDASKCKMLKIFLMEINPKRERQGVHRQ
jgi:hypothetical protein